MNDAGPSPSTLVRDAGGTYSGELGIDLSNRDPDEIYKWFLAALLFGARISGRIAIRTYREFERAGVLAPRRVLDAGWKALVALLDSGGYTRYDFKTATKLLDVDRTLLQRYGGNLNALHDSAADEADLEQRLKDLGKGIGDTTVSIFLRELRGIWPKANPVLSGRALAAAKALGFVPTAVGDPESALQALMVAWKDEHRRMKDFPAFEAALVRSEAALRRRKAQREAAGKKTSGITRTLSVPHREKPARRHR